MGGMQTILENGVVCQEGERSQVVGLWELFNVKCKNLFFHNKQNLFIKKICTISTFFKLVNFAKGAIFS